MISESQADKLRVLVQCYLAASINSDIAEESVGLDSEDAYKKELVKAENELEDFISSLTKQDDDEKKLLKIEVRRLSGMLEMLRSDFREKTSSLLELVPDKLTIHDGDLPVQEAAKRSWNACVDAMLAKLEIHK